MRGFLSRLAARLLGERTPRRRAVPEEVAAAENERKERKKEMHEHNAAYARRMAARVESVGMGGEAKSLKNEAARKEAQARAIGEELLDERDLLRLIGVSGGGKGGA